jgi:hypothetical protein
MISSRVMMAIIFFLVVTPIGLLRKLTGADSLKIKQFKKSNQSVMLTRDHQYEPADLEKIF